jgi:hypothetical protein
MMYFPQRSGHTAYRLVMASNFDLDRTHLRVARESYGQGSEGKEIVSPDHYLQAQAE